MLHSKDEKISHKAKGDITILLEWIQTSIKTVIFMTSTKAFAGYLI